MLHAFRRTVLFFLLTACFSARAGIEVEGVFLEHVHVSFDHQVGPDSDYTKLQVVRWLAHSATTNVLYTGGRSIVGKLHDTDVEGDEDQYVFYGIRGVREGGGYEDLCSDTTSVNPPLITGKVLFDEHAAWADPGTTVGVHNVTVPKDYTLTMDGVPCSENSKTFTIEGRLVLQNVDMPGPFFIIGQTNESAAAAEVRLEQSRFDGLDASQLKKAVVSSSHARTTVFKDVRNLEIDSCLFARHSQFENVLSGSVDDCDIYGNCYLETGNDTLSFKGCVFYGTVRCKYAYTEGYLTLPYLMGNSFIAVGDLDTRPNAVHCVQSAGTTAPQDEVDRLMSRTTENSYWGGYGGPPPNGYAQYWLDNFGSERTAWTYLFNHRYLRTGSYKATTFPDADRPMPKLDVVGARGGQNTLGHIESLQKMLGRAGRDVLFCFDIRTNAERLEGVTYYLMIDDTTRLDPQNGSFVAKRDYGKAKNPNNEKPDRTLNFVLPAAETDHADHKVELFADTRAITRFRDEGNVEKIWYSRFQLNYAPTGKLRIGVKPIDPNAWGYNKLGKNSASKVRDFLEEAIPKMLPYKASEIDVRLMPSLKISRSWSTLTSLYFMRRAETLMQEQLNELNDTLLVADRFDYIIGVAPKGSLTFLHWWGGAGSNYAQNPDVMLVAEDFPEEALHELGHSFGLYRSKEQYALPAGRTRGEYVQSGVGILLDGVTMFNPDGGNTVMRRSIGHLSYPFGGQPIHDIMAASALSKWPCVSTLMGIYATQFPGSGFPAPRARRLPVDEAKANVATAADAGVLLLRGNLSRQTDTSGYRYYELDPDSVRGALLHTVGLQPFTPQLDFHPSDPLVVKFIDRNGNQQGVGEVCKHDNADWPEKATWEQAFSVPAELGSFKIEWNNTYREVLRRDRGATLYNSLVGPLPGSTLSNSVDLELTLTTADNSYDTRRLQRHEIYYSINGGANWEIMMSVEPNTPYTLSTDFLPSGTNVMFKALSTDGIQLDEFHIGNLTMQDRPPDVQISSPLPGDRAPTGTVWFLSGEGHDIEDGLIPGGTWTSSVDGELGTERQRRAELSQGVHTLSYVVQDSGGHTVSQSVHVTVAPVTDIDLQLAEDSLYMSPKGQDPTYGFKGQLRANGTNVFSLMVRNGGVPNVCTGAVYITPPVGPETLVATGLVSMAPFETGSLQAEWFCPAPGTYRVRAIVLPATNGVPDPNVANNMYTWTFEEEAPWAFGEFIEAWIGVDTRIPLQAFDPDGLPISYRIVDGPDHGSVYGLDTTNPVYRSGNYVGEDTLQYVANDGTGDSPARTITIQVRGRAPEKPADADASDGLYETHVQITWSAAEGATGYIIKRDSGVLDTTTETSYQDTTADPGVNYTYWVISTNIAGNSAACPAGAGSRAAFAAPTALTATGNRVDGVFLQWRPLWDVYGEYYRVHRQTTATFDPSSTWVLSKRDYWEYLDEGATPGQIHYYFVRAYKSGELGAVAGPVSGLRLVPELDVPEFWVTQGEYADKIVIEWRPVEGADSYYITYKFDDQSPTDFRKVAEATGVLYEHTGLSVNRSYDYRIRADRDDGQQSPQSGEQRGYTSDVDKPTNLTATQGTHPTQIVLNWTAASGVNWYAIFRASVPWLHKAGYLLRTQNVTWTDVNPTPGKRYYYWVRTETDDWLKSGFAGSALGHAGPLDPWDAWSHASLTGLTPNESDPAADPDGDGQANAFEFLYRLDPQLRDGPPAPVCETREVGGLSYFVLALPASVRTDGVTVSVQHCPDLSGNQWSTAPVVTLDAGPPPVFGVRAGDQVGQCGYLRLRIIVETGD